MAPTAARRLALVLTASAVVLSSIGGPAEADFRPVPEFSEEVVDANLPGAAFSVHADMNGDGLVDPVVSSFGDLSTAAAGGGFVPPGTVAWYQRTAEAWTRHEIVTAADGIRFPGEPTPFDVDGDGDLDVIVPGGFFACALYAVVACGSLGWYEQVPVAGAPTWVHHEIVPYGSPLFFHRAVPVDIDGDGRLDLMTTGETVASAQAQIYFGDDSADRFSSTPVELGPFGGSLPSVDDVDGDGDLDMASAQFFMPGGSFAWLEQVVAPTSSPATPGVWVSHTMTASEGGSIMLAHVPGVGWVGSNHTNTTSVPVQPAEGIYVLTPGADPRLPWSSELVSEGIQSRPHDRGLQGAPGVFGWGDVDGDGDVDLAVSGDGDRRIFWLENVTDDRSVEADGWVTHTIAGGMGQAGGGRVADFDGNPANGNEILFSSYDARRVVLYRLDG